MPDAAARPALVLDSPSLFYRAFFALPISIRDPQGHPVNAVRGYLDMVSNMVRSRLPRSVLHVFDNDWRPAFRVAAYPGYKATRRPDPPDLPPQLDLLHEVLAAAGQPVADAEGYEADDVIGCLAARASAAEPIEVVTGDRDLLQLVRDPAVAVLFTVKGVKELRRFDEAEVEAAYGVPPRLYADLATLRGDTSDGLPGVAGVGPKTAATLLATHGSLDALRVADDVSPRIHQALQAQSDYLDAMRSVVPLPTDVPIRRTEPRPPDHDALQRLAEERALRGSIERLEAAIALL
ncbi:MAG TPA: 5'-3' exonuclease [Candidatus Dormibacteraeota bacterium]|nr:5'-3' exonuclease [Candidatus Dormibacteraeota bacterium]